MLLVVHLHVLPHEQPSSRDVKAELEKKKAELKRLQEARTKRRDAASSGAEAPVRNNSLFPRFCLPILQLVHYLCSARSKITWYHLLLWCFLLHLSPWYRFLLRVGLHFEGGLLLLWKGVFVAWVHEAIG
jgi:hypothetical protein